MSVQEHDQGHTVPDYQPCYTRQFHNRNQFSIRDNFRYEVISFLVDENLDKSLLLAPIC